MRITFDIFSISKRKIFNVVWLLCTFQHNSISLINSSTVLDTTLPAAEIWRQRFQSPNRQIIFSLLEPNNFQIGSVQIHKSESRLHPL